MASRYSAARPKRAGEAFARTHHGDDGELGSKRVRFDVRNPSTLAPDAREEDAVLEADVIGGGNATKRGAVNLDGYDSDSDHETFDAKAASRKKGHVNILEQLDHYDAGSGAGGGGSSAAAQRDDDDGSGGDEDMFAAADDGDAKGEPGSADLDKSGPRRKDVRFLDASQIEGQEDESKSGGHVRLDEQDSSDDEEDVALAIQEEGLDEEVGAGGLKRNAPKIEAFNLREEMEQGRFDQDGNYVRRADDPDAVHDSWLEGVSKKQMRRAAEAHEKRQAEARRQRLEEDGVLASDLLKALIVQLERAETPLEALARLARKQTRPSKVPRWKLKKMSRGAEGMDVDAEDAEDPVQAQIKASINAITDAADKLLSRDHDVYDVAREMLVRQYRRETGEDWVEPSEAEAAAAAGKGEGEGRPSGDAGQWEFRWTDGRDGGATQGPFDSATMEAWQQAGYFGQGVEFRPAGGGDGEWTGRAAFGDSNG